MKPILHPKCGLIESFMARYHMSELRFEIFAHLIKLIRAQIVQH